MSGKASSPTSVRLAALVVAGLGLALPGLVLPCTCLFIPFATEYANTSHVFTAHKVDSHTAAPEYPDHHYEVLAVHAVWKGSVPAVVEVLTGDHDGICGLNLETDREYLVFANENGPGGPLATHSCSRTGSYPPGDEIWTLLGPPLVTPASSATWGAMKSIYRR